MDFNIESRCARIGLFTDRLVLRRIPRRVSMRRRRDRWARILRMRRVVSMRARFSGHVPKGQKFIAQGKRSDTLGYGGRWAFSPHSLTFNTATLTRTSAFPYLLTRLLSREPTTTHTFRHGYSHASQRHFCPILQRAHPKPNALSTLYIPHSTIPIQHTTFNIQHSTHNIQPPTSIAQQFTSKTQHSTFNIQHPTFHIIKCWG